MRFASVTLAAVAAVGCGARTQLGVPDPLPRDATTADVSTETSAPDTSVAETVADVGPDSIEIMDCGATDGAVAGDPTWLHDECLFRPLPSLTLCDVHEAMLPSPRFPARTWTSCGEGCRVVQADLAGAGDAEAKFAWVEGERVYVPLAYSDYVEGTTAPTAVVQEIWEASEAKTMVALETRNFASGGFSQCIVIDQLAHTGPVDIFEWWHDDGDPTKGKTLFYAVSRYRERSTVDVLSGSLHLSSSELPPNRDVATDSWWAQVLGSLRATNDFHHLPPHPVAADPGGEIDALQTDGDAFYWMTRWPGVIHRWSKGSVYERLYDRSPRMVTDLAVTKSNVTWIESAYSPSGPPTDFALVTAAKDGPPRVVSKLEDLSGGLATNATYAATEHGDAKHIVLRVLALADGRTVMLGSPPGRLWGRLLGMTPSTLYVGVQAAPDSAATLRWIYALDLAKLDALAKAWPP